MRPKMPVARSSRAFQATVQFLYLILNEIGLWGGGHRGVEQSHDMLSFTPQRKLVIPFADSLPLILKQEKNWSWGVL